MRSNRWPAVAVLVRIILVALAVVCLPVTHLGAQPKEEEPSSGGTKPPPDKLQEFSKLSDAAQKNWKSLEANRDFAGIKWGVGVSLTFGIGGGNRVESAEVVNGIVRVTEERNEIPRVMLESHYFFVPSNTTFLGIKKAEPGTWGWGPFVGIQNGQNELIQALGAGMMFGFRRKEEMNRRINVLREDSGDRIAAAQADGKKESSDSFNIGLGFVLDTGVKTLGDDIEENRLLPAGETEVRFKKTNRWGGLLLFSFGF